MHVVLVGLLLLCAAPRKDAVMSLGGQDVQVSADGLAAGEVMARVALAAGLGIRVQHEAARIPVFVHVVRMDALPEQVRLFGPRGGGMSAPLGDALADELEAPVGRLAEEHAGPVFEENFNRGVHVSACVDYLFSAAKVSTTL